MIKVSVFTTWCQIVLAYPTPGIPLFLYPLLLPSVKFFTHLTHTIFWCLSMLDGDGWPAWRWTRWSAWRWTGWIGSLKHFVFVCQMKKQQFPCGFEKTSCGWYQKNIDPKTYDIIAIVITDNQAIKPNFYSYTRREWKLEVLWSLKRPCAVCSLDSKWKEAV